MSESLDQYIQNSQLRWAQQDTTAAIRDLKQETGTVAVQYPAPNPQIIYINDRELWKLDSQPQPTPYSPDITDVIIILGCFIIGFLIGFIKK